LSSGILSVGGLLITNFAVSGSSLTIEGVSGTTGGQYAVLASTDVTLPVSQWTPIVTNALDSNGNFSFTTNYNTAVPKQFFMVRTP